MLTWVWLIGVFRASTTKQLSMKGIKPLLIVNTEDKPIWVISVPPFLIYSLKSLCVLEVKPPTSVPVTKTCDPRHRYWPHEAGWKKRIKRPTNTCLFACINLCVRLPWKVSKRLSNVGSLDAWKSLSSKSQNFEILLRLPKKTEQTKKPKRYSRWKMPIRPH